LKARATSTIPIVFGMGSDTICNSSLMRPRILSEFSETYALNIGTWS
jgi:hypothetical protein